MGYETSPDRQVPTDTKYMAIDVETHNHNCKQSDPQVDTSREVEVVWMLFHADGTMLEEKKYLQPYGEYEQMTESATNVHDINMFLTETDLFCIIKVTLLR